MASKKVPVTYKGKVIGVAEVNSDGTAIVEITDPEFTNMLNPNGPFPFSISSEKETDE